MGDGEFGLRSYIHGFQSISNPIAKRSHLKAPKGGLREFGSWDGFRSKGLLPPKPVPSVLYFMRKYFGNKVSIFYLVQNIPISIGLYRHKGTNLGNTISLLLFLIFFPLIVIQVLRSWLISSEMIKKGSQIGQL